MITSKLTFLRSIHLVVIFIGLIFVSCDQNNESNFTPNVSTEVHQLWPAIINSNRGNLNYGSYPLSENGAFYEDDEYKYYFVIRQPKFELLMLPFYMKNGNWLPAYSYDNNASIGSQINPKKIDDTWLCSMVKVSSPIESDLANITDRITNFSTNTTLDIQPFEYRNCFYGYITTYGGKKVNIRFRCSFLKYDRNQGSSTYGYIQSAQLEYQYY